MSKSDCSLGCFLAGLGILDLARVLLDGCQLWYEQSGGLPKTCKISQEILLAGYDDSGTNSWKSTAVLTGSSCWPQVGGSKWAGHLGLLGGGC